MITRDSYFTILVEVFTNHIVAENTYFANHIEWIEHAVVVLKPANKYQIIWQCYNFRTGITDKFFMSKSFLNLIFYGTENDKLQQFTIQIFIYYLIFLSTRKIFQRIMQHMFFNEISRYIKIHFLWPLTPWLPY